ncbi:hypothetical protein Aab01nite_81700 [Paractinoplanes abujensis]|uniref:Uncharacterized protein n=1 Tax=Paractinoplanes abujensis TaxID=882441 RepID=A0A7W7CRH9_9ACTN|nr:hypothetical protein [Actinoplanes abujensis]MBB4693376.1 hypothetical protein [Actinoplanes abujensis]GID24580.1 hypothetical protein Aab01nite_81700 [Actinoplanes abujensis]
MLRTEYDSYAALVTRVGDTAGPSPDGRVQALAQGVRVLPVTDDARDAAGAALADDPDLAADANNLVQLTIRHMRAGEEFVARCCYVEADRHQQSYVWQENGVKRGLDVTAEDGRPGPERALNVALRLLGVDRGDHPDEATAVGLDTTWGPA